MIRVDCFTVSLDGYGAGSRQSSDAPMGVGGERLHGWAFATRTFRQMFGQPGGSEGVDEGFAAAGMAGLGAWVMGRNMFAPSRGPWPDDGWRGWWGEDPPYHCPVHVLTHHPRAPLEMSGGTVFHFETGGLEVALQKAANDAGDRDVRIGGGVATVREALLGRLVDRVHLAVSPVLLGSGEALWPGIDLDALGYRVAQVVPGEGATHLVIGRVG